MGLAFLPQSSGPQTILRERVFVAKCREVFFRVEHVICGPRGGTGGAKPGSGVQRFWGPLGASEFDPSFQQFGVSETPSQRPLRAPERL